MAFQLVAVSHVGGLDDMDTLLNFNQDDFFVTASTLVVMRISL